MRGENLAKHRPKCYEIAKIFVVITLRYFTEFGSFRDTA